MQAGRECWIAAQIRLSAVMSEPQLKRMDIEQVHQPNPPENNPKELDFLLDRALTVSRPASVSMQSSMTHSCRGWVSIKLRKTPPSLLVTPFELVNMRTRGRSAWRRSLCHAAERSLRSIAGLNQICMHPLPMFI